MGLKRLFIGLANLALKVGFLRPFVLDRTLKTPIIQALVKKASSLFEGEVVCADFPFFINGISTIPTTLIIYGWSA